MLLYPIKCPKCMHRDRVIVTLYYNDNITQLKLANRRMNWAYSVGMRLRRLNMCRFARHPSSFLLPPLYSPMLYTVIDEQERAGLISLLCLAFAEQLRIQSEHCRPYKTWTVNTVWSRPCRESVVDSYLGHARSFTSCSSAVQHSAAAAAAPLHRVCAHNETHKVRDAHWHTIKRALLHNDCASRGVGLSVCVYRYEWRRYGMKIAQRTMTEVWVSERYFHFKERCVERGRWNAPIRFSDTASAVWPSLGANAFFIVSAD